MAKKLSTLPVERIERAILVLRGQKVILDEDIAALYGVETKTLIRAMKRNVERGLRSQTVTSNFQFHLEVPNWSLKMEPIQVAEVGVE